MSFDSPKSQTSWKTKYDLPYHLLTDGTGKVGLHVVGISRDLKGWRTKSGFFTGTALFGQAAYKSLVIHHWVAIHTSAPPV